MRTQTGLLAEKESRAGALRQMIESGEGFGEGTQAVLRGLDNADFFKPAIGGLLASLIRVETADVAAVEAAFGQNLQSIVMKDAMVAESVLKTLSEKQWGRTHLILREWQGDEPAGGAEAAPEGTLGWARERVKTEAALEALVALLLGRFAIVPDLDTALRLGREQLHKPAEKRCDFVTVAGEVVTRHGILTGGRAKGENAGASALHRKNQAAALEEQAGEIRTKMAALTTAREAAAARLDAARTRLSEAREEAQKLTVAVSACRGELQQLEREERENAKKVESLTWEQENVRKRHEEAVEKIAGRETETQRLGEELAELQGRQQAAAAELDELRTRESALTGDLNELRIKVATEKQRHDSLYSQRAPMTARLNELRELIQHRKRDIDGYLAKIANLELETGRIHEEIEAARERLGEAVGEVTRLGEERGALVGEAEEIEVDVAHPAPAGERVRGIARPAGRAADAASIANREPGRAHPAPAPGRYPGIPARHLPAAHEPAGTEPEAEERGRKRRAGGAGGECAGTGAGGRGTADRLEPDRGAGAGDRAAARRDGARSTSRRSTNSTSWRSATNSSRNSYEDLIKAKDRAPAT